MIALMLYFKVPINIAIPAGIVCDILLGVALVKAVGA